MRGKNERKLPMSNNTPTILLTLVIVVIFLIIGFSKLVHQVAMKAWNTFFESVSLGLLLQSREFEFRAILIPPPSLFVRRKAGVESVVLGCAVDGRARLK